MNKRLLTITLAAIMAVSAGASVFADTTAPAKTNDDVLLIAENPNEETNVENNEITVMGTYLIYNVIVEDIKENTIIAKVNGEETHFKMTEATIFNSKTKDIPTKGDALKIVVDGNNVTLDFGTEWGFWANIDGAGYIGVVSPGIKAVKN